MTLRAATHADLPAIAEMGRLMHAGSNFAPMAYDPETVMASIGRLIDQSQFVVVAEEAGELIGGMAGMVIQSWFGRDYVANDLALFVKPGYAMTAVKLIRTFVSWAKLAGARQIRPGVSTGSEAAQKLYHAYGFQPAGRAFVLNVEAETMKEAA